MASLKWAKSTSRTDAHMCAAYLSTFHLTTYIILQCSKGALHDDMIDYSSIVTR